MLETEPVRRVLASSQVPERRVLRFYGVSESAIARSLAAAGGDGGGVDVTICARDFELHVDLFVENGGAERADAIERQLVDDAGRFLFARREVGTAELVLELLRTTGMTLATAESCTGGLVGARLTDVPGSSDVFLGGAIVYSDAAKQEQLGVSAATLAEHGAVSAEVAAELAQGARAAASRRCRGRRDGNRGAWGGTAEKPVGLVFVHAAGPMGERDLRLDFPGDRETIRGRATVSALHVVRRLLTET